MTRAQLLAALPWALCFVLAIALGVACLACATLATRRHGCEATVAGASIRCSQ